MKAILALDPEGGIGKDNGLPWPRLAGDLPRFKQLTMKGAIIMGRNTWDSLPTKPLPGRTNIVITSRPDSIPQSSDVQVFSSIADAVKQYPDAWLIGGAQLINSSWNYITELHLSRLNDVYDCDTFIDVNTIHESFTPMWSEPHAVYTYEIWERNATV